MIMMSLKKSYQDGTNLQSKYDNIDTNAEKFMNEI